MTEEERKKLLEELRSAACYRGPEFEMCERAANEIERLAIENDQLKVRIELLEHEAKYGGEND